MEHWPYPPFFRDARGTDEPPPDALIFRPDGSTLDGVLQRFEPDQQRIMLLPRAEDHPVTLGFGDFKSLQLIHPVTLVVDDELAGRYRQAGGKEINTTERPFQAQFQDGEHLQGHTRGFVKTSYGLFFFLLTGNGLCVRIFIPTPALQRYQVGGLLGMHLVSAQLVPPATLDLALHEQARRQSAATEAVRDVEQLAERVGQVGSYAPAQVGDILLNQGLLTHEQMQGALVRLRTAPAQRLGGILIEMGALTRAELTHAVAEQLNIPLVALDAFTIDAEVLDLVAKEYALDQQVLPLMVRDRTLVVAVESPQDADFLDDLRFSTQRQVVPVIAPPEELAARITREYSRRELEHSDFSIEEELRQLNRRLSSGDGTSATSKTDPQHQVSDNDTLVVRLVNKMISDAQQRGASDIHIETYPEREPTLIRLRVDGDLTEYLHVPYVLRAALLSRLKIMANLDISEHRMPQDGKIDFSRFAPTKLELRVAVLPTTNGLEDMVLRLLASSKPIPLDRLGLDATLSRGLRSMVHRSYGLILVCGPTGSGKTTTLHSLLAEVNNTETKIWTAEDPIEITQPGLRQIQINPRIGLTFAMAMRSFLRADPDVIMVGEMRDSETAHIAIEASLTGHLVLSTLHTNSAPESVIRMLDMGLDPFNFADALVGVLSQRLARRLCGQCKQAYTPGLDELHELARDHGARTDGEADALATLWQASPHPSGTEPGLVLYRPKGCDHCGHTGYKGRVGIYELMTASPALKKLIQSRAPVEQLFETATQEGMLRLMQYGVQQMLAGVTDIRSVRGACA